LFLQDADKTRFNIVTIPLVITYSRKSEGKVKKGKGRYFTLKKQGVVGQFSQARSSCFKLSKVHALQVPPLSVNAPFYGYLKPLHASYTEKKEVATRM